MDFFFLRKKKGLLCSVCLLFLFLFFGCEKSPLEKKKIFTQNNTKQHKKKLSFSSKQFEAELFERNDETTTARL